MIPVLSTVVNSIPSWADLLKYTYRHFLVDAQLHLARLAITNKIQLTQLMSLLLACYCMSVVISGYMDSRELMQLLSDGMLLESFDVSMMGPIFATPLFIHPFLCLFCIIYQLFYHLASERSGYSLLISDLNALEHDAHGCRAPPYLTVCL